MALAKLGAAEAAELALDEAAALLEAAEEAPVCPVLTLDLTPPDCSMFLALETLEDDELAELLLVGQIMGAPG
jgi:hypothetical protein